jgi:TolA-binding protein
MLYRTLLLTGLFTAAFLTAQETDPETDPVGREVRFIQYLADESLFQYANLAVEEARTAFPDASDRLEVAEVAVLLRQGKTAEVEEILSRRNLATDPKAQAMLLQLAMTYDALRKSDVAVVKYQQFLDLNEGKEITDPDVLRYFASAGLRLAAILQDSGDYDQAAKVLNLVVKTTEEEVLKRKFLIISAQNRIDQALSLSGSARETALNQADELITEILYGANDQYLQMAIALKSWKDHLTGDTGQALEQLSASKNQALEMERLLEEADVPASEYPRPAMRLVEGIIQWDQAKAQLAAGDRDEAKKNAIRAAGNFYNTFLKYEGNEYGDRAALQFEDLKVWVEESFGSPLKGGDNPRMRGLIFKRQLDLAKKLLSEQKYETAQERLLDALSQYPETDFTTGALDTLSRIWIEEGKTWELLALSEQLAEQYPDTELGAQVLLRIGREMAEQEDLDKLEKVLGAFGRNFPSHPRAPAMLFRVAEAAQERGANGVAMNFHEDILELYPESTFAVRVLQIRGEDALNAENVEEALLAFEQVRDRARDPMQAAFARLRIIDAKLISDDPELRDEALEELIALRSDLQDRNSEFYEEQNREQTLEFLQNARYRLGRLLLQQAGIEKTAEARAAAAAELNSYLEDYPNTDQSPQVMFNLGRLYLQQGEFDKATRTFDTLAATYPDSEAGRDALYSLVKAALEEDQVEVARQAVDRMVLQPDSYEVEKIFRVATLMAEFEQWEQAKIAYELVRTRPETQQDDALKQRVLAGLGEAAIGAGDLDVAVDALQGLISEFPTSSMVMRAGVTLAEAYLAMEPAKTQEARQALTAVSRVLRSRPDKTGKARLDLTLGKVSMAEDNPSAALANWYGVGLTEANSPELAAIVKEAITLSLEEAQRQIEQGNDNRWNLVVELTEQYLNNFPMATNADEMRALNVRAIGNAPEE